MPRIDKNAEMVAETANKKVNAAMSIQDVFEAAKLHHTLDVIGIAEQDVVIIFLNVWNTKRQKEGNQSVFNTI